MIRVLIVADGMNAGGTERQIVELLRGLRQDNEIYTFFGNLVKGGAREQEAHIYADEVWPVRQSCQLDLTMAWSLTRFVHKKKIDIIHTFGSISDISGVIASKISGARLVNGSIRNARKKLTRRDRISRFTLPFADQVVANSRAGLRAYGVYGKENTRVIYNGVSLERFKGVTRYNHPRPYICMVGNYSAKKDHEALIRAYFEIVGSWPQLDLVLVGSGEKESDLRVLVDVKGYSGRVHFITDCTSPEAYIKGAEVCVLLSPDGEGLSNVIIEYSGLSKPVIASNLGGNPEIVEDGETGILVSSHSVQEVSQAITRLLSDKDLAEELGGKGQKRIVDKFSLDRMVSEYSELYKQLLHR